MILSILFALAAILSTPNVEPVDFVVNVIAHCEPITQPGVTGCEAGSLPGYDERDYAAWTVDGPQVGP